MSSKQDLLIEIGTEEMPPTSLKRLGMAFQAEMNQLFETNQLSFETSHWLATPRRLALLVTQIDTAQEDIEQEKRGPSLDVAFDANGKPGKATEGFARSVGATIDELETIETDKGQWLAFKQFIKGKQTVELVPEMVETALGKLPIAKRMRWGSSDIEFVRPVKWLLFMLGGNVIDCEVMGINSGNCTYGHRFLHPDAIRIKQASDYIDALRTTGKVVVDFDERQSLITQQVNKEASTTGGEAIIDPALLDEVTALVEWPMAFTGEFDKAFLELPGEVLIATMQDHQKYFPVRDKQQRLLPCFIGVANIVSKQPELIKLGNERVIQPRLSDASFFWKRDINKGLASHVDGLGLVIYQKQLGTLKDRMLRLQHHCEYLAPKINASPDHTRRAAELCFCDLLTEMVFEFPELQGTMGKYYAEAAGETDEVCAALEEFYCPRFAGDNLPDNAVGQSLAIAEKIDSLLGIFAIGKAPTGAKDPFALRRAAIGLLRIIIECELDIDLPELLNHAAAAFPESINAGDSIADVLSFLQERLRRYYLDAGIDSDTLSAVLAVAGTRPLDFHHRLQAVTAFRSLSEADSLAAANKRIANILKKNNVTGNSTIDPSLLQEEAEKTLATKLEEHRQKLKPLLNNRDYQSSLSLLAGLRESVDNFFDQVMVMCDDEKVRQNRLALLQNLNKLFLEIADISRFQG